MFAAQIVAPRRVRVIDAEEPQLDGRAGRIKIRLERSCLCGSDTPLFNYDYNALMDLGRRDPEKRLSVPFLRYDGGDPYPMRVGQSVHECLGTVVQSTSPRFKEGDFVLALPDAHDGLCEYMESSADRAVPLPRDAVPKEEILMTQPLGTVVWACQKLGNLLDADAVVVGQGPMGLMFSHMLSNLGARTVVAMDKLDYRLEVSRRMRATHTVNVDRDDAVAAVREITGGKMADLVVEVVGHQTGTINSCLDLVRRLGAILCFGVPDHERYEGFRYSEFFRKNVRLIGSVGPDVVPNFSLARDMIAQGRIDVSPLVSHVLPFGDVQRAYELFVDRKDGAVKVVLDYESKRPGR